jgi:phage I-like protein/2'-5' RNA ligase
MPLAIVLPLPAEVAARVAMPSSVPGALPASELHVTLCVLTSAPPDLFGTLASLAARSAPIDAQLSGVGRFAGREGEPDAFHLTIDAPALGELRNCIEAEHYRFIDRTHGLDPHLTLAYLAPNVASPLARIDATPVRFDALAVWDGPTRTMFPFGSAMDHSTTLDAIALPDEPPTELRLFRDGWNDTTKGRFLLDAEGAAEAVRRFAAHGVELSMDFDHGTFGETGKRRDVPGYIGALEHRVGDGLYATGIRWTEVGLRAILPGRAPDGTRTVPEYRYVSPAVDYDPDTRRVVGIKPVALVSYPATHGQRPLVMSAARATAPTTTEPRPMPMKSVLALLGLADNADESTVLNAVQTSRRERDALLTAIGAQDVSAALGKLNALTSARTELDAAQKRAADAEARIEAAERRELLSAGKAAGKLTPALEKLYGDKPVAELKAFLEAAPVIPALAKGAQQQPPPGKLPASVPGVPDKAYAELSALEKDRLLRANPLAFEQLLSAHEAQGGDGTRGRAALARFNG